MKVDGNTGARIDPFDSKTPNESTFYFSTWADGITLDANIDVLTKHNLRASAELCRATFLRCDGAPATTVAIIELMLIGQSVYESRTEWCVSVVIECHAVSAHARLQCCRRSACLSNWILCVRKKSN